MPLKEGLYVWDNPWAPAGALTDTLPGSAEREFLDELTDPSGDYCITPFEIDSGYQKSYGIWNYGEARNNIFRFSEAIEFIEQFPNGWSEFRPLFDEAGILDPLDSRDIPTVVKERMAEIRKKVEKEIGLTPENKDYCDGFVPRFYQYGIDSFDSGGLCFNRSFPDNIYASKADEAFKQCADTGINKGRCEVKIFMIYSAFEHVVPQCHVTAVSAPYYKNSDEGHIFAEYKGMALDPSNLGRSSDSENTLLTKRQLISYYHHNLGVVFKQNGDLIGAEHEFRQAIQWCEDYAEAHNNLGVILETKRDLIGAAREYGRAIQRRDDFPEAHNNLGVVFGKGGDLLGARYEFRRAIQLREDFPEAHNNLGNVLSAEGDLIGAESEYRRAIKLRKDFSEARYNLDILLEAKGK